MIRYTPYFLIGSSSFLASCTVVGWTLGPQWLTSIDASMPAMKLSTAIAILCCAVQESARHLGASRTRLHASLACLLVISVFNAALAMIGSVDGVSVAIAVEAGVGEPSLGASVCFFLVCASSIVANATKNGVHVRLYSAYTIMVISAVALAGFAFGVPAMYYFWPPASNGIAIHTAAAFALLAGSMMCPASVGRES